MEIHYSKSGSFHPVITDRAFSDTVHCDILSLYDPLPFIINYIKSKLESIPGGIS